MESRTMKLICDLPSANSIPDNYVLPPEKRPCNQELGDDLSVTLPVIDLQETLGHGRQQIIGEIMEAGKEFGFFQVVNHGVEEDVIKGFREAAMEFFRMPEEAKLKHYSTDMSKAFRVFSGSITSHTDTNDIRYWRDCLKIRCYPVDKLMHHWPSQPEMFRERLAKYGVAVEELGRRLLGLIAEGLGLANHEFFEGGLTGGDMMMNVNYYPACPDPSLTLGIRPHSDRFILTVLSQGDIVTNGVLKSVEHRALTTNSATGRLSVATFTRPTMDCMIGPAPGLVNEEGTNSPKYRAFTGDEFTEAFEATTGRREPLLDFFKIRHTQSTYLSIPNNK